MARDLCRHSVKATGRQGLPAEAVSRCALLKQCRQLSYPGAGLPSGGLRLVLRFRGAAVVMVPAEVGGVEDISLIRPGTWEEINRALLLSARQARLEEGSVVRLVSTVTPQHRSLN